MQVEVINRDGQNTGRNVELPEDIFQIEPNDHAIYLDVKQFLANQRQGTHKAKERAEIVGSTKKLKRQKGTGTARAGSIKSPVFRGGGRIFGPRPRNYSFKLNKKLKSLARKSALTYKVKDEAIKVIEDFTIDVPRTKDYLSFLEGLSLNGKKTIFLTSDYDKNLYLSSRNIQGTKVLPVNQLNTYEILHADNLLITEKSVDVLKSLFAKEKATAETE